MINIILKILKFLGKAFLAIIAFLFFLGFGISFFSNDEEQIIESSNDTHYSATEINNILYDYQNHPDSSAIAQDRCWNVLHSYNEHCMNYSIRKNEIRSENSYRELEFRNTAIEYANEADYWAEIFGQVYEGVYKNSINDLQNLKDSLSEVAVINGYDQVEFANLLVSFVQDMEYWYIASDTTCFAYEGKGSPCIARIKYGFLSPAEMAATAIGDCDTRSLLLYCLFRHFGYEPVIFLSLEYAHAMLGLNIPSSGKYLIKDGRKFYFWETTAKNWESGMMSPDNNNLDYWTIALPYDV